MKHTMMQSPLGAGRARWTLSFLVVRWSVCKATPTQISSALCLRVCAGDAGPWMLSFFMICTPVALFHLRWVIRVSLPQVPVILDEPQMACQRRRALAQGRFVCRGMYCVGVHRPCAKIAFPMLDIQQKWAQHCRTPDTNAIHIRLDRPHRHSVQS